MAQMLSIRCIPGVKSSRSMNFVWGGICGGSEIKIHFRFLILLKLYTFATNL